MALFYGLVLPYVVHMMWFLRRALELLVGDFRVSLPKTAVYRMRGQRIVCGVSFRVRGLRNIDTSQGQLLLGTAGYGSEDSRTAGLVRVRGRLIVEGRVVVGVGSRFDIGPGAVMRVGSETYFSPRVRATVMHGLSLGNNCAVAWDVEFLDENFHDLQIDGDARERGGAIAIGNHVWICSGARINKGVTIADGCVIAAGALVTRSVEEPNSLVGGVPARVLRSGVNWT